ncbi:tyrosine kinase, putative, partial [Entamoeba invadens IP1]
SDVFAYSIVCYEVWLRAVPYTSFKYKWEVSAYVAAGNRLPIPKDFPSGMGELIEKCWGQDPLNRPTFKEIADEMHEIWLQQYSTQKGNLIKNTICKIETSAENLLNN